MSTLVITEDVPSSAGVAARRSPVKGIASALLYVATIVLGNAALSRWGVKPVGFGLTAPVAVYFVGVALVARDGAQYWLGKGWMLLALAVGCVLSFLTTDPMFALASTAAFVVSELCDFALFTWIAPRWARAVLVGGLAAALFDSLVFLHFAFHSYAFLPGQMVGKGYGIVLAALLIGRRRRTAREA